MVLLIFSNRIGDTGELCSIGEFSAFGIIKDMGILRRTRSSQPPSQLSSQPRSSLPTPSSNQPSLQLRKVAESDLVVVLSDTGYLSFLSYNTLSNFSNKPALYPIYREKLQPISSSFSSFASSTTTSSSTSSSSSLSRASMDFKDASSGAKYHMLRVDPSGQVSVLGASEPVQNIQNNTTNNNHTRQT